MSNDNKQPNNDEKNACKKNSVSSHCKPCMPIERNENNAEKSGATKNPSTNQTSNVSSCYAKCVGAPAQQDSQSASICAIKTTVKPFGQVSSVGSCYAKCGPPSVQLDSSSTSTIRKSNVDSVNAACEVKPLSITNPFIEKMDEDILYHIALGNKSHDLPNMFGDIKFVVMGSTPKRMEQFAYFIANQMKYELAPGTILNDISKNSHRYAMFKVGPVLSVSHGMGTPSIGILLHELIKLMSHAGVKNPTFVRIGTCGGFNKNAGTVVVSNRVVNDFMEPFYELAILGKKVRFPANLDQTVVNEIISLSEPKDQFEVIAGATYCTDNFYEGSGRADGAICEYSEKDSLNYYKELQKSGVVNVEMESLAFAALTCRAGIKSAILTVILSDRLETDQIKQTKEVLDEWQTRPQKLLAKYIKKKLSIVDTCGATSATKVPSSSTTSGTSTCKSCGGPSSGADLCSGQSTTADTGTTKPTTVTTTKPTNSACSTVPIAVCKPCGGTGKITETSNTTNKPSSSMCGSYQGTGKDITTFAPKCTGSDFSSTPSTIKPADGSATPFVCKPCVGSEKGTDDSTPYKTQSLASTTRSPRTVVCKCCEGGSSVCQSHTKISNEEEQKAISSTTSAPNVCKPCTPIKSNESSTTSTPSFVCKPCTGSASAIRSVGCGSTTPAPSVESSSVCKPCIRIGSSSTTTPGSTSVAPTQPGYGVCKPCISGLTPAPATNNTSSGCGSTTPVPSSGTSNVCKPCVGIGSPPTTTSGTTTSAPSQAGYGVCKPCISGSTPITNNISTTTKAPDGISANVCKPCVGSNTAGTTGGTTAYKPATNTTTTSQSVKKEAVCKPCIRVGSTSSNTTDGTSICKFADSPATASSQSNDAKGVCKPCGKSTSTSQSGVITEGKCRLNEADSSGTTTSTSSSKSEVLTGSSCKSCEAGSTTTTGTPSGSTTTSERGQQCKQGATKTTPGVSSCRPECNASTTHVPSNVDGVCKLPAAGGTTTVKPSFSIDEHCNRNVGSSTTIGTTTGGTSTSKPAFNGTATESFVEKICRRNNGATTPTEMGRDLTTTTPSVARTAADSNSVGTCKPCSGGATTTPASGLTGTGCSTTAASGGSGSTCVPNMTSTKAPDTAKSTTSRLSAECATSTDNSNATANNGKSATERKRSKCVPYSCYTADKTDNSSLPTTPKAYLAKDFDSSSNSTISNDSWRSCYQKCSSKAPISQDPTLSTTYKPQTFQTPEQDNFKGVPPALGPCCAVSESRSGPVEFREVPYAKGPFCASLENESDSNDSQVTTTESTPLEKRKTFLKVKTEPESTQERPPSSKLDTATPTNDQVVDAKLGPCCAGRSNEKTFRVVSSSSDTVGPCCSGKWTQPQDTTTSRGTLCSGKAPDDSPDEPCGGRKSSQETSSTQGPDSKSSAPGPFEGNIQGCPITIGGSCNYTKDDGQSQSMSASKPKADSCDSTATNNQSPQNGIPKPSPDTPDTSITRAMPAFVTPTPPSTKGIICCSKFINSNSVLVTANSAVSKEANKYDESPSPCASCKKFQEGKTRNTGSTSSDSQPEIIKCVHKLKRLKDECQGYD